MELFLPDSSPPILIPLTHLASVAQRLDSAIHRINLYPVDSVIIAKKVLERLIISLSSTYPVDSDLSGG